jgi:hypothetical protein
MISIIDLVLSLLSSILPQLVKSGAPEEIIKGIQAAIASLTAVQGTPVTFAQLESLRVQPTWETQVQTPKT